MDGSGPAAANLDAAGLDSIAIVGAACRLPGAPDLAAFEQLLFDGVDAVGEIPDGRWAKYRYFHPERGQPGKTYTFAAGLIEDVAAFDAAFFGISPREAAQMDPQQRLLLELAHEAIEDAGLDGAALAGTSAGVYVGGSSWDYQSLHNGDAAIMDAYSMTGATLCSLANRVSFAFDLHGPSLTLDTACSSSLVALHQACEAIRAGQVPLALVGGVNLLLSPNSFVGFSAASMLSPQGRCHAFDARADGYVRAEGGAMIVLRPLREALARGDTIHALIRGTGMNSDGRTTGISLPSRAAQADLLRSVYGRFGLDPQELGYLEAHGTGTPAGDPIEAGALGEVLGRSRVAPLPVGSVKTNIGHLEAASGMAGLLKAMLVLQRGVVPASLHCETPNPAIPFADLNLRLVPEAVPVAEGCRLAGINSFGFGGTNAHAVLEAADGLAGTDETDTDEAQPPLLLSARSTPALRMLAETWRDHLAGGDVDAATLRGAALAREAHRYRLVVHGATIESMGSALTDWLAERGNHDAVAGEAAEGKLAFVFSGNGSQWSGMGLAAAQANPRFRRALATVDAALLPHLGWSVSERLARPGGWAVEDTTIAQPLLFAVQVATTQALRQAGIHADMALGHSVGEVAAAWATGALQLGQACQVIAARSRLQSLTAGHGRMAVLGVSLAQAEAALAGMGPAGTGLEVAAINASNAITIAGPAGALDRLAERAVDERWPFAAMDLDHAFHSAAMDPVEAPLRADLASLQPPHCPDSFISTMYGGAVPDGARLDAEYWWRNVRAPVRFAAAAAEAVARGARILIEIGPQPVLQAYLRDALAAADANGRAVATLLRRSARDRDPIALAAARCHVAGADMRGAPVFAGPRQHRTLPAYPWQRERHWLGHTVESTDLTCVRAEHPLLGARQDASEALEWTNQLGPSLQPWLADHVVGGAVVAPAALLVEMALAAAQARYPAGAALQILDFEIARPMTFEPGVLRDTRLRVNEATGEFHIASRARLSEDRWTVHASGQLAAADNTRLGRPMPAPVAGGEHAAGATLYARAAAMGLEYGPAFQVVTGVDTAGWQQADVALAPVDPAQGVLLPPTLLDGAFQGLVGLAAGLLPLGGGVVPWRFGRVCLLQPAGAVPRSARVAVTRIGPRSVRADIHLLDAAEEPLAELLDCWFVRVQLGSGQLGTDHAAYHVAAVASTGPDAPPAGALLPLLRGPAPEDGPEDAHLLAEAFVAAAVAEAVRRALPDPDALFTVPGLVAAGLVQAGGRDRCAELLGWLEADGLATVADGRWRLAPADGGLADDILRTLVFDTPATATDAALLAGVADTLDTCLSGASQSVADHLLTASPAAQAAGAALAGGLTSLARAWPDGQPLRVLHLGARRGGLSRHLIRVLRAECPAFQFHAVTEPDDAVALTDALAAFPEAAVSGGVLPPGIGPFDIAVGFGALTLGAADIAAVLPHVAGGLLLLAEPGPSRVWSLLWPDAASRLHDGAGWALGLADAGAADTVAGPIPGGWGASLLTGRVAGIHRAAASSPSLAIIADPASALADGIEQAQSPATVVDRIGLAEATAACARWTKRPGTVPSRIALVAGPEDAVAPWLDRLARCAAAAPQPCEITIVAQAGPLAAALGGLRRVIANELPDAACRQITLAADLAVADAAQRAAAELSHDDGEPEITWSATGRTVPRLRPGLPAPPHASAATRLSVARPGLLDTIGWDEAGALPPPGPGQVAIRVHAAGLNFRDVMWAMGMLPDEALLDGFAGPTLGLECAGEVTAVGDGVTNFTPGDRVMAFAPASLSSHTVTAAHAAVRMPPGLGYAAAATIPVAFMTVAYSLGHLARLEPGERVLVHGGAGGVGLAAIQYAKGRGATVFATAGTAAKRAMLRRLGVDAVLDSRSLAFADEVMRLTGGEGVDVVLNSLSGPAMELSLKLLRPFGRFLELGKRDFYGNTRVGLRPFRHNIAYFGVDVDQLPLRQPKLAAALLSEVAGMMAEGSLRPLPYRVFAAADAADAFRVMQASGHIGKIVLAFDAPVLARPAHPPTPALVRADRSYLVTGGLDGFGLQAAHWLAECGAKHLALVSRRGDATPGDALATLRAKGVTATAFACDVADEAALATVLAAIRAAMPPLGGVIHAAVAMDDGLLPAMDAPRFERALRPKLHGLAALDRLTRPDPIDLFVVFSSVTTVLGNPGQANYVAANAAAEAVVEARRHDGLPGLAVQWGPIGDAGYLSRERGVADQLSKRLGEPLMTAAEALAALPMLLGSGLAVAGLARVRWGQLGAGLPLLQTPMYAAVRAGGAEGGPTTDLATLLADCTPEEAQARLTALLTEEVARIMRMPAGAILPHRPLAEFGMDSLMAVELRLAVEQRVGLTLPVMALSDGVTLTALAARMARTNRSAEAAPTVAERLSRFELPPGPPEPEPPVLESASLESASLS